MKQIFVRSYLSTGLNPKLASARVIDIEDTVLGEGGFGVAYCALAIDGQKVTPQVIKLLTNSKPGVAQRGFDTIQELQRRVSAKIAGSMKGGNPLFTRYPALQALPQLSFEGELEGHPVLGYSANDLTAEGYEEFGKILDNEVRLEEFQKLPLASKLQLATQLVAAFRYLSNELRFIHADIKVEAIFIDLKRLRCAIIDFDSGALARTVSDAPLTFGTLQDWLAPEIALQLKPSNQTGQVKVNLHSDVWSVNIAVHYLLFTLHPFFFLTEISERSLKAYIQKFHWPEAGPFPFFDNQNASRHKLYFNFLTTRIPFEILSKFDFTFNQGYFDPVQRTSYGQWEAVLYGLEHPVIHDFQADRLVVRDTRPVRLSWNVAGAARIQIAGTDVTGRHWLDVNVRRDTRFELVVTSVGGQKTSRSVNVRVSKDPPVVSAFRASTTFMKNATPVQLAWQVSGHERIEIDNGVGNVTGKTSVEVMPRRETVYTLIATSPFGVSATSMVRIQVSSDPPVIAYFRSDRNMLVDKTPPTLSWLVSDDACEVSIRGIGPIPRQGSMTVTQRQDTTYTLVASSYFGQSTSCQLLVRVSRAMPVITAFKVSPIFIREGMEVLVRWQSQGAEEVFLEPQCVSLAAEGEMKVCVPPAGRFLLRAVSFFGMVATKTASVAVLKKTTLTQKRTKLTTNRTFAGKAAAYGIRNFDQE